MTLSPSALSGLRGVGLALNVPASWLEAVINFETAGTWNPQIKNPLSTARGLIQFLDATAVDLGYQSALDLVTQHPTIESQLTGPVLNYFKKHGPFRDEQDFVFSVFLPKYRHAPLDTLIYHDDPVKMDRFQRANPGIKTVGDYFNKLRAAFSKIQGSNPGSALGAVALGALAAASLFFF